MKRLRILLADDHTVVREGLKRLVEAEEDMTVVGEASNGREAVERAVELKPDVLVMDISMPGVNGAQAARELKQAVPEVAVLTLTVHEDKSYVRELLAAGACGYVLKRTAADELIRAVRTVAGGNVYVDPRVAGPLLNSISLNPEKSFGPTVQLSTREEDVLRQIANGYSNKEIADKLQVSVKTVETYKARSMKKLDLRSRVDLVRYATDLGWLRA